MTYNVFSGTLNPTQSIKLTNYGGPQRMHTTTTASHSVHFWCGNCKYLFVGEQK